MAQASYNPLLLQRKKDDLVYNLSSSGQSPDSSYFILRDLLASHKKPRWVILDIYWVMLEGDPDFSELAGTYERIVNPDMKREVFQVGFSWKARIYYTLPVLRYRQDFYWWMEERLNRLTHGTAEPASAGAGPGDTAHPAGANTGKEDPPAAAIDYQGNSRSTDVILADLVQERNKFRNYRFKGFKKGSMDYVVKLIELCRKEQIRLYVVAAPILPNSLAFVRDYDLIHSDLQSFLDRNGQTFLDLNLVGRHEHWLDPSDYADENHPNASGADKISRRVAKELPLD